MTNLSHFFLTSRETRFTEKKERRRRERIIETYRKVRKLFDSTYWTRIYKNICIEHIYTILPVPAILHKQRMILNCRVHREMRSKNKAKHLFCGSRKSTTMRKRKGKGKCEREGERERGRRWCCGPGSPDAWCISPARLCQIQVLLLAQKFAQNLQQVFDEGSAGSSGRQHREGTGGGGGRAEGGRVMAVAQRGRSAAAAAAAQIGAKFTDASKKIKRRNQAKEALPATAATSP